MKQLLRRYIYLAKPSDKGLHNPLPSYDSHYPLLNAVKSSTNEQWIDRKISLLDHQLSLRKKCIYSSKCHQIQEPGF